MLVSNTLTIGDLFTMLVFPYKGDLFTMLVFLSIVTGGLLFEHSKLDVTIIYDRKWKNWALTAFCGTLLRKSAAMVEYY